ncbi:MAG TPA: DUF6541 family protein [Candidatus Nanoarchaeia archaeon]|nr:DUF6541 family protein [Candidatus Nanoarchaeia archaeon]
MKINRNYLQTFIFVLVYLFAIYFWSQPYQERGIPYGEYDAMSHFEVADYIAYNDKSFSNLPPYIDLRYGADNDFKPHTLWYPPTFHSALAVSEAIGGERIVPVYLMNTILATFIIITVYFVINSLFGFLPAILSSLLIIFSPRDFMPFLWGQWPERFGYAFIPIILYCLYQYFISYSKENSRPGYLYLTALFLGINILIHPLVFFHSLAGIAVLYIFLAIKQKKLALSWKHISVSAIIFIVIFMLFPYQTFNIFSQFGRNTADAKQASFDLSRLFQWSLNPADYAGSVPASYFSFSNMHGLWTLPFLLIGIFILLWRREEKDLFLLAWLVALYLVLHRDLIGKATFLHRSLSASAHIFAPLTAVGAVYLASAVKLPPKFNTYLKYALVAVFVYLAFTVNMKDASAILNKNTYNPNPVNGRLTSDFLKTLTQPQFEAAEWILENAPPDYNLSVLGIPYKSNFLQATAYKIRWFAAVSQHVSRFYYLYENKTQIINNPKWYFVLDYTMLGAVQDKEAFDSMQAFEKEVLANYTLAYNKNDMRVYKLETKQ